MHWLATQNNPGKEAALIHIYIDNTVNIPQIYTQCKYTLKMYTVHTQHTKKPGHNTLHTHTHNMPKQYNIFTHTAYIVLHTPHNHSTSRWPTQSLHTYCTHKSICTIQTHTDTLYIHCTYTPPTHAAHTAKTNSDWQLKQIQPICSHQVWWLVGWGVKSKTPL